MYLAQNLICLREKNGITQSDLADILGVSRAAVGNWEAQNRVPDIEMIIRLAGHFNMSLDDLVLKDLRPAKPMYAANLKYLREKHEMSQEEMAHLIQTSKSNISKYENGSVRLSVEQIMKISEYFGFTLDQFVKQNLSEGDDAYDDSARCD